MATRYKRKQDGDDAASSRMETLITSLAETEAGLITKLDKLVTKQEAFETHIRLQLTAAIREIESLSADITELSAKVTKTTEAMELLKPLLPALNTIRALIEGINDRQQELDKKIITKSEMVCFTA